MDGKKVIEVKCKGADILPIDRILEFQGELKTLSKSNEKKLRNSILKFGFIAPFFVWDDKGEWRLLDGHQRLKTLLKMREEGYDIPLLPVDYIEADSEEDAKRKLLHITSQYGEFSPEGFENFTLELDGFENIRLTDGEFDISFLRDDDEVKDDNYEIPDEIETDIKVGDIFQIGEHRLMCGDSTDAETVAKLMDGQKADMIFTDPPYLMGFEGNVHADGSKSFNGKYEKILNDKMSKEDGDEFIFNIFKIIKKNVKGAYYVSFYRLGLDYIFRALNGVELKYRALIIWDKGNHTLSNSDYMSKYEPIVYGWVDEHNFYGGKANFDIWQIDRTKKNDLHPTMKPVALVQKTIEDSSKKGNLILDLFGGSGTTMVASHQLNRTCYMMELDPKYCQVIIDRMRALDGAIEIRRNGELYD